MTGANLFYNGHLVKVDDKLVKEDWSRCRSPARARRRRRQGHPQRVVVTPDLAVYVSEYARTLACHPVVAAQLRAMVEVRDE